MSSILGSFIAGQQAGQQQHQYRQEQSKLAQLRELAPSVLAGDPAAYGQSMALDSAHTGRLQDGRMKQLGQLEGMVKFVDAARATNDPRQLAGAMRTIAPFMKTLTGQGIDPDAPWTPEYDTGWEAFKAQVAGARSGGTGNNVQSTYINADGKRVAIMRDGSQQVLGDANQSIRVLEQEGAMPYGVVTSGGVAGQVVPLGGGQQQAQLPGAYIDPSLPPEVQAQIRQSIAAGQEPPGQMVFASGQTPMPAGGPVRTPTAGERAAATERAKLQAQLDFMPEQQAIETQGAIDRAVGVERGKAQLEQVAAAPGAISTMEQSVAAIDELLNSPDLGSIVGLGSMNPLNRIPGTAARGLIARAEQIGGQAFLAAFNQLKGGGAITDREGAAATAAMARLDRSQSLADYQAALRDLRAAITPALERQRNALARGQQPGGGQSTRAQPAAAPVQRARNPQTGQVVELRNGQWVPVQ